MRGGKQRDDFEPRRWSGGLVQFPGGRAPLLAASTAIPETSTERGAVWRGGCPRTRERRAEWRVGGPRARESGVQWQKWRGPRALGCSGLGVFHAVGRPVGCSSTAALGPARQWPPGVVVCAPSAPLSTLEHFSCFDSRKSAMVGGSCGCAFSPLMSL